MKSLHYVNIFGENDNPTTSIPLTKALTINEIFHTDATAGELIANVELNIYLLRHLTLNIIWFGIYTLNPNTRLLNIFARFCSMSRFLFTSSN